MLCLSLEVILTIEGPRLLGLRSVFRLGIYKMESLNHAALLKHIWHLCSDGDHGLPSGS